MPCPGGGNVAADSDDDNDDVADSAALEADQNGGDDGVDDAGSVPGDDLADLAFDLPGVDPEENAGGGMEDLGAEVSAAGVNVPDEPVAEVMSKAVLAACVCSWRAEMELSLNCLRDHLESTAASPDAVGAHGEMSMVRAFLHHAIQHRACISMRCRAVECHVSCVGACRSKCV